MNDFAARKWMPALLLWLGMSSTQAQDYPYYSYSYPQPGYGSAPTQFNMPQSPPQGWPQAYGYPGQPPQLRQQRQNPPLIEAEVSDDSAFEQQSLVYSIRVIGEGNLKTATPQLPQIDSVVLRQLGDSVTGKREVAGQSKLVTEYRYLLMPLTAGAVEIPPAEVSGVHTAPGGGDGPSYRATSAQSLALKVRPAAAGVQPWLPLYKLKIDVELDDTATFVAGNPLQMVVKTTATGATGTQIPSIASQLVSDDFRVYPGKNSTAGQVSADGSALVGSREEHFTLVPLYGGWIQVPALELEWWNVRLNRPEVAVSAMRPLRVTGPDKPGTTAAERGFRLNAASLYFWIPLLGAVIFILYFWINAFFGTGEIALLTWTRTHLKPLLGELYEPLAAFATRISPRRRFHRLRTWTGRQLPVSWKLWFCLRAVAAEDDPEGWGQALQLLAAKHLGVRPNAPLKQLGESIVAFHPRANAAEVDRLMSELDRAVYGGETIASFARWKDDFRKQIKPSLWSLLFHRQRTNRQRQETFARLNPR